MISGTDTVSLEVPWRRRDEPYARKSLTLGYSHPVEVFHGRTEDATSAKKGQA
jgi:hypothetical protein